MPLDLNGLIQLGIGVVAVAAAAVWLKSSLVKQRHAELEELAKTRGHRIADLKAQIDRQGAQIRTLQSKVEAVEDMLTTAIAERVAVKVIAHLENNSS